MLSNWLGMLSFICIIFYLIYIIQFVHHVLHCGLIISINYLTENLKKIIKISVYV